MLNGQGVEGLKGPVEQAGRGGIETAESVRICLFGPRVLLTGREVKGCFRMSEGGEGRGRGGGGGGGGEGKK